MYITAIRKIFGKKRFQQLTASGRISCWGYATGPDICYTIRVLATVASRWSMAFMEPVEHSGGWMGVFVVVFRADLSTQFKSSRLRSYSKTVGAQTVNRKDCPERMAAFESRNW